MRAHFISLAAAQAAAPETTMLPDAPEQHLDEYPMPDPTLTQDDLEKSGYLGWTWRYSRPSNS